MDNNDKIALRSLKAWQEMFLDNKGNLKDNARIVLNDLADMTYATRGGFHEECKQTGKHIDYYNGTRDVFYHIMCLLNIDIYKIYEAQKQEQEYQSTLIK